MPESTVYRGLRPRFEELAEELVRRIGVGEFRGRERLPSEPHLAKQFGVGRETVRDALAVLAKRGVVRRRRGVGTFVAAPNGRRDITVMPAFYESLLAQGLDPVTRLLDYRLVTLDDDVRGMLEDDTGMLLVRQYLLENSPFAVTRAYLPRDAANLAWSVAEANPIIRLVEVHLGVVIARAELTVRAAVAGVDAELLGAAASDPVLTMERRSWSAGGRPLELTRCTLRADAFEFSLPVAGPVSIVDGFRRPESRG